MRRRIGIHGATNEALALIPLLSANPGVEVTRVYDERADEILARLPEFEPGLASLLEQALTNDLTAFVEDASLEAVIDADEGRFAALVPNGADRGLQIVTPLTARLLWGYGTPSSEHKTDLLKALHEIVESHDLTIDTDELFTRMLEIAMGVTGADGGSVMLLAEDAPELRVRVAVGVEPELWPKIRVPLGEGIAGRVAAEGRPLRLRGVADRQRFRIVRERLDVESALCVPLVHDGRILGVLNLHHGSRPEAFSEDDLAFTEELARLDAQIIARAQEHDTLRSQASRYAAVREVNAILGARTPLPERLTRFCAYVAEHAGGGIANVYLVDPEEDGLRLAATSLAGGHLGGEYRFRLGEGIDGVVAETREPSFLHRPDGALAYAALPLCAGDLLAGVLSVQAGPGAVAGRAAEETLQEIAAGAAEEISQALRESRISARATTVGAINEAGIRMISATDPAEVLRLGTSSAAMVLEADHAVLRLQDDETRRYVIRSYFGSADGRLQERLFHLDKHVSVDVLKRRAPLLVRDVAADPRLAAEGGEVRSLMAAPLQRDGRVIGTLALYDKVAADRFYPGCFGDDDLDLFSKFVSYLERAVANALFYAHTQQFRNFDEDTGLPNAAYLVQRIREEVARAGPREGALAVAVARIDNYEELERQSDPVKLSRVNQRVADALRERTRDYDVVGRTDDDAFAVLLPEPGRAPGERVFEIARAVADDVSKDERLNEPVRISLAFGYAIYPADGSDPEALLDRARVARIRMV